MLGRHSRLELQSSLNQEHLRGEEALQQVATSLLSRNHAQILSSEFPATPATISENTGVTIGIIPVGFYALNLWASTKPIVCCVAGTPSDDTFYSLAKRRFRKSPAITVERSSAEDTIFQLSVNSISIQLKYHQNSLITKWSEVDAGSIAETVKRLPWESRECFSEVQITNNAAKLIEDAHMGSCFLAARDWAQSYGFESHIFGGLTDPEILALTFNVVGTQKHTGDENTSNFVFNLSEKHVESALVSQTAADMGLWKIRLSQNKCAVIHRAQKRTLELLSENTDTASAPKLEPQWPFFLSSCDKYIQIDFSYWGSSTIKGGRFVRAIEHALAKLLERLIKRYPRIFFHAWPRPFTQHQQATLENGHESFDNFYAALYIIGYGPLATGRPMDEFPDQDYVSTTYVNSLASTSWEDFTCSYTNVEVLDKPDGSDLAPDIKNWGPIPEESRRNESSDEESDEEPVIEAQPRLTKSAKAKFQTTTEKLESLSLEASESAPKPLRPALDILHRIQYDASLDSSDYIIGYLDRHTGVLEMPLEWWVSKDPTSEEFIPQSRIRYFKRRSDNEVVWDREERKDLIFGSGKTR